MTLQLVTSSVILYQVFIRNKTNCKIWLMTYLELLVVILAKHILSTTNKLCFLLKQECITYYFGLLARLKISEISWCNEINLFEELTWAHNFIDLIIMLLRLFITCGVILHWHKEIPSFKLEEGVSCNFYFYLVIVHIHHSRHNDGRATLS